MKTDDQIYEAAVNNLKDLLRFSEMKTVDDAVRVVGLMGRVVVDTMKTQFGIEVTIEAKGGMKP
jgi:hypothetical protein